MEKLKLIEMGFTVSLVVYEWICFLQFFGKKKKNQNNFKTPLTHHVFRSHVTVKTSSSNQHQQTSLPSKSNTNVDTIKNSNLIT